MGGAHLVGHLAQAGCGALALLFWQTLIWIEWKPLYAFPPPAQVFATLGELVTTSEFWLGVATTMRRCSVSPWPW